MDRLLYNWILPALVAVGLFYLIVDILVKMSGLCTPGGCKAPIGPTYPASLGF